MQTSPEIDFQKITKLLQKFGIDTQENLLKISLAIGNVLNSGIYKDNLEVQKLFEEVRKREDIETLNYLYQILSLFDKLVYLRDKKNPVISIFQENIPKILDFLSIVGNRGILKDLMSFIDGFEKIFQEIFSFSEIQELILPSDNYEDIKMKLTQYFSESGDKNIVKLLSLLEDLEKMMQNMFLDIVHNPYQTIFSFFQMEKIINQYKKIQGNLKPEKAFNFYISLLEVALDYFSQKQKGETLGIQKEVLGNMILQYFHSAIKPKISDLEGFLGVVVYAFGDGTNKMGGEYIKKLEQMYEKNYAGDKEKKERLLGIFRQFFSEKKYADFYMFGVNDFSQTLGEFQGEPKKSFLENPENIVSGFRFSDYEGTPGKKAEYIGAMNITPEFQGYGLQGLMNEIIYERIYGIFEKEKSKVITPEGVSFGENIGNIPKVDEFYAHVIADTSVERLWKKMGFVATGNDEEISEDGKKVIRREIILTKESFLQRYK